MAPLELGQGMKGGGARHVPKREEPWLSTSSSREGQS